MTFYDIDTYLYYDIIKIVVWSNYKVKFLTDIMHEILFMH